MLSMLLCQTDSTQIWQYTNMTVQYSLAWIFSNFFSITSLQNILRGMGKLYFFLYTYSFQWKILILSFVRKGHTRKQIFCHLIVRLICWNDWQVMSTPWYKAVSQMKIYFNLIHTFCNYFFYQEIKFKNTFLSLKIALVKCLSNIQHLWSRCAGKRL